MAVKRFITSITISQYDMMSRGKGGDVGGGVYCYSIYNQEFLCDALSFRFSSQGIKSLF